MDIELNVTLSEELKYKLADLEKDLHFYQDECDNLNRSNENLNTVISGLEDDNQRLEDELEQANRLIQDLAAQYGHSFI